MFYLTIFQCKSQTSFKMLRDNQYLRILTLVLPVLIFLSYFAHQNYGKSKITESHENLPLMDKRIEKLKYKEESGMLS